MADDEEKKPRYKWWTVDELEILLAYVQQQDANEKTNYVEVVEMLAAEGYERTEKQVQKKFEKLRWQSKAENKTPEMRLQEMIDTLKGKNDDEEAPVKSPKATTPKHKQDQSANETSKEQWNLPELEVLLECILSGNDKPSLVHDRLPHKHIEKVRNKVTNTKSAARTLGVTPAEIVKRQIKRITAKGGEESSEEEEKTPARGTKRKLEETNSEERSAKKQRVIESPRLTGPKNYDSGASDSTDVKQVLEQIAKNNRVNFANLRNYIREKFEESRNQYEELSTRMTNIEDKMDTIIKKMRASRANGNSTTPSKSAAQLVNKERGASNKNQTPDSSPSKQPVSYFQFL